MAAPINVAGPINRLRDQAIAKLDQLEADIDHLAFEDRGGLLAEAVIAFYDSLPSRVALLTWQRHWLISTLSTVPPLNGVLTIRGPIQ